MGDSTREDGRPAFQFYPDDWLEEPALKCVSMAAQGLWMHMLCRMFKSPERGVLLKPNGKQMSGKDLANMIGKPQQEVDNALGELVAEAVCSTRADGTVYSRRMVRDEELRKVRAAAGAKGGKAKALANQVANSTPSSSSSVSSSSPSPEKRTPPSPPSGGGGAGQPTDNEPEPPIIPEAVQQLWLKVVGGITTQLAELVTVHGYADVAAALRAAEDSNPGKHVRGNYIRGILQRWATERKPEEVDTDVKLTSAEYQANVKKRMGPEAYAKLLELDRTFEARQAKQLEEARAEDDRLWEMHKKRKEAAAHAPI